VEKRDRNRIPGKCTVVGDPLSPKSPDRFICDLAEQTRDEVRRILLELRGGRIAEAIVSPYAGAAFSRSARQIPKRLNLLAVNDFVRITSAASDAEATVEVARVAGPQLACLEVDR
jgi:hypothetical protein